jgi:hypothetical protein
LDYDSHNKAAENFTDFVDELLKKIKGDSKWTKKVLTQEQML